KPMRLISRAPHRPALSVYETGQAPQQGFSGMTLRDTPRHSFAIRACALAITAALGCAHMAAAHAENLMDAYRQALQSDPVLKQAEAQQRIGRAGAAISLSPLLPQING